MDGLTAYICWSRFNHQRLVVPGKSGMKGMTSIAMAMVMAPSMINSHSQAGRFSLFSIRLMMPAAMSPPNALASMLAP